MSKTDKLLAIVNNDTAEIEWAIANQILAGLDSSIRQAVDELVGSFNSLSKERWK